MNNYKENKLSFLDWLMADDFYVHEFVITILNLLKYNRSNMEGDYNSVKNFFMLFKGKIDEHKLNFTLRSLDEFHDLYKKYLNDEFEVKERLHRIRCDVTKA